MSSYKLLRTYSQRLKCELHLPLSIDLFEGVKQSRQLCDEFLMCVRNLSNMMFGVERPKNLRLAFKKSHEECFRECEHKVHGHELKSGIDAHDDI